MNRHERHHLLGYLENRLDSNTRAIVERHLAECVTCNAELAELRRGSELMRGIALSSPPTGFADRVIDRWQRESAAVPASLPALSRRMLAWRLASSLLLVVGGGVAGYALHAAHGTSASGTPAGTSATRREQYVLFLLEPDSAWPTRRVGMRPEYVGWARRLRAEDRLVSGEELTEDVGTVVRSEIIEPDRTDTFVSGIFIVKAMNYAEAASIARTSPHLRHGGRILVRQIN